MRKHKNRPTVGTKYTTKQGCEVEILEYISYSKILIKFNDAVGLEKFVSKKELLNGMIKNPYHPDVRGVGFFGEGPHVAKVGNEISKEYTHWSSMLSRCYYQKYHERFPTYIGCSVDPQWHNFQEFAEWCQWQVGFGAPKSVLDKDLLLPNNKIYSPEACVFLPAKLNNLIVTQVKPGKNVPAGISFQESSQKYIVSCAIDGKNKNLGRYKCPKEAFKVYKDFKENLVKEKADEYKDQIDPRAYFALVNYKVAATIN